MLISFFNPSDLIGCGGDINQSDSFRYARGYRRWYGRGYAEGVCGGGTRRGYAEGVCGGGMRRGYAARGGGTCMEGHGGGMRRGTIGGKAYMRGYVRLQLHGGGKRGVEGVCRGVCGGVRGGVKCR